MRDESDGVPVIEYKCKGCQRKQAFHYLSTWPPIVCLCTCAAWYWLRPTDEPHSVHMQFLGYFG